MRYLTGSARFSGEQATALLDAAERDGNAAHERATVTFNGEAYEVHRPGFAHGFASYNYLDDLHPVECELCFCKHYRHNGRSNVLRTDPPSTCRCGHMSMRHRFRQVRETLDVCKAPETWLTEDMRAFNALRGN